MPGAPLFLKNLRVDALPVIPDPQAKLPFVIVDFHFDLPRLSVPRGIAQRLAGNPVDFVADDRMQVPRRAFYLHPQDGGIPVSFIGCEFFSESADGQGKVVGDHRG